MVTPEEFLAEAERLLKNPKGELDYRNSVVNAYYGAYHAVVKFEEALPQRSAAATSKPGSHDWLIQRLERPHPQLEYVLRIICQELGAQMRMLKALRELASYEIQDTVRIGQAEEALGAAKDICKEVVKGSQKLKKK